FHRSKSLSPITVLGSIRRNREEFGQRRREPHFGRPLVRRSPSREARFPPNSNAERFAWLGSRDPSQLPGSEEPSPIVRQDFWSPVHERRWQPSNPRYRQSPQCPKSRRAAHWP